MSNASAYSDVLAKAVDYSEAVYFARAEVFEDMCHDRFQMTLADGGGTSFWDKASYLKRVRDRDPFSGKASYEILSVDVSGSIARVHLWVDVPPLRYEDHLGFVNEGGTWRLLTKVFRTAAQLGDKE